MRRLLEDPQLASALRDDLLRSRVAGEHYEGLAKLPALRAALADTTRDPLQGERSALSDVVRPGHAWRAVSPLWKLAVIVALGGAAVLALRAAQPSPTPAPLAAARPVELPKSAPVIAPREPVPEVAAPSAALPTPEHVAVSPTPSATKTNALRREIAQLVRIRALLDQDPRAAYRLARRSEQEFPRGALSEERQGLLILALAKSGELAKAEHKAREFFAHYPPSSMRTRLEAALR